MKALSISPVMAWAIMYAGKDIENRATLKNFRGDLAVHASAGLTRQRYEEDREYVFRIDPKAVVPAYEKIVRGAILGTVEVVDCVTESLSPWYDRGFYGFVLQRSRRLAKPIPCKGRLNFWEVPRRLKITPRHSEV